MNMTPHIGHHEIDRQQAELDHVINKALAFCGETKASTAGCTARRSAQQARLLNDCAHIRRLGRVIQEIGGERRWAY